MPEPDPLITRQTLLLRLRDPQDHASWSEFTEIYTPLLYGFCRKRGIGSEDTADIIQDVMRNVARAIGDFDYDPARGRFKTWLFTCLRNAIASHFRKENRKPLTPGQTQLLERLDTAASQDEQDQWELDYQRQLLTWAMDKIRPEYGDHVWNAFVATALHDRPNQQVAAELDMTPNAVGVAKHRITQRLKAVADSVDAEQWEQELLSAGT